MIEAFTSAVHRAVKLPEIILYGSRLLGTDGPGSDIDLIVLSNDFTGIGQPERRRLVAGAIAELEHIPDVLLLTPQEWMKDRIAWIRSTVESQYQERDAWRRLLDKHSKREVIAALNTHIKATGRVSMEQVANDMAGPVVQIA